MAYIVIEFAGKKTFGGYLSVDGEKKIKLTDDMLISVPAGTHYLDFSSQSGTMRGMANLNAAVGNYRTAAFMEHNSIDGVVSVNFGETGVMKLTIVSDASGHVLDNPSYEIVDMDEEAYRAFDEEYTRRISVPRRGKSFGWGIGISILSLCILLSNAASGDTTLIITWIVILAVGILMTALGAKKRVRIPK